MEIKNIAAVDEYFIWKSRDGSYTEYLSKVVACNKVYVNLDYILPSSYSCKYHSHHQQEEFFLIVEGSGILRYNGEEYRVKEGDIIAKPAGRRDTHQFYNDHEGVLKILDVGSIEAHDVCEYPDEGVKVVREGEDRHVFCEGREVLDWDSDGNK